MYVEAYSAIMCNVTGSVEHRALCRNSAASSWMRVRRRRQRCEDRYRCRNGIIVSEGRQLILSKRRRQCC